jgi:type IV secretory pathway VirB4 component
MAYRHDLSLVVQVALSSRDNTGEVLEERESRVLGELAGLPGNGQFGLRPNIVTSKNVGDLAMVYRLSPGDKTPFLLFGDRKGGVFAYSLFTRREPSWNKAVLGLPGSGKSMLMNAFLLGNANFDSQGFVLDKGNSFGPVFELLAAEMPDNVAVMRLRGGDFRFNPFPLVWALDERERQKQAGAWPRPGPCRGY